MKKKFYIKIKNEISEMAKIVPLLHDYCDKNRLSQKTTNSVDLVLDEIINNIISYGYDDEEPHHIEIYLWIENDKLHLIIEDDAKEFNPLELSGVDTESSIDNRKIGGTGLYLVHTMMDELQYTYLNNKNRLTLKKQIEEV